MVVLLEGTPLAWLLPYADPAVVIALVILSAPLPIGIVRANWRQLLGRAPGPAIQQEARSRVDEALRGTPGVTPHLRMLQTGRTYYLQVYLRVGRLSGLDSLKDLDRLRERVCRSVLKDAPDVGLDVVFTRDPKWLHQTTPAESARIRT
jgi:predicted Co/Zn/Cd cation transporter (cation efflux family)